MHREMNEYKEDDDLKLTQEELKYLENRQRLKERIRRKLKNESSSTDSQPQMQKKLPYYNYGSFFGPSRPVISKRVLEESKSILETQHLHMRKPVCGTDNKMGPISSNEVKCDIDRQSAPKAVDEVKKKVQKLKESRDYSFLFSDDAELPTTSKEFVAPKVSSHTSGLGSNGGNGPDRPLLKTPLQKASAASIKKKNNPVVNVKPTTPTVNKSKLIPMSEKSKVIPKQPVDKSKVMLKKPVPNLKPQMKPSKQLPARPMREDRPKKRPLNTYSDEEDMDDGNEAISLIRSMFGYNPKKYADVDDDVSDMEANFDDILKEEKRSSRIAREEDERELRLIEEEERRAKMRKAAKKRQVM